MCKIYLHLKRVNLQVLCPISFQKNPFWIVLLVGFLILMTGCMGSLYGYTEKKRSNSQKPRLFIVILDALRHGTLMESLDSLPNFQTIIKGNGSSYPYIYFENVLVSIPSSSKPSNTTLLTGVYPRRHGVSSTMWFNRKEERIVTLTSLFQGKINNILEKTKTDTIFDYARRSGKSMMAVATQVTKGVDSRDWIQQSVHLWGQAFLVNLFQDGNTIPDGSHLDRGTTKGLFRGYLYSFTDGLEGRLRVEGDIPDLIVLHYVGLDIFTHYPRQFMVKENWTIDQVQKWYLKEVLDPELGKITTFLRKNNLFENIIFFFVADHGQTKILKHIDEGNFEKRLSKKFRVMGRSYSIKKAEIIIMPGASTKTIYVRNKMNTDWMLPLRLLQDLKPVVDFLIDGEDMRKYLNALLVAQYPGERDEGLKESDAFWYFNLSNYCQSGRKNEDFMDALEPLSKLDEFVGTGLKAAFMYSRDFNRENTPDIILINKPGYYFTPDKGKYAHHGSIYPDDAYVSFVISGPAVHLFSARPQTKTHQIGTVDLVPMAAYLTDIKIGESIDGKNWLLEVE